MHTTSTWFRGGNLNTYLTYRVNYCGRPMYKPVFSPFETSLVRTRRAGNDGRLVGQKIRRTRQLAPPTELSRAPTVEVMDSELVSPALCKILDRHEDRNYLTRFGVRHAIFFLVEMWKDLECVVGLWMLLLPALCRSYMYSTTSCDPDGEFSIGSRGARTKTH